MLGRDEDQGTSLEVLQFLQGRYVGDDCRFVLLFTTR